MADDPNIVVNSSSTNAQLMSSVRDLLKVIGAGMVTKGFIDGAYVEPLIGLFMVLGPILWSQFVVIAKKKELVTVANADPKDVTVK